MEQHCILIVDDDREIVHSLGKLLELEGYKVIKAYNPFILKCAIFLLSAFFSFCRQPFYF